MKKRFLNGKLNLMALIGAVVLLCSFTQIPQQKQRGQQRKVCVGMELSEDQQSQMKAIRVKHLKETQELRNELAELRVHQNNLMSSTKPNQREINQNVDQISKLKIELMKKKVAMKVEMRSHLTEEQKVMCAARGFEGYRIGKMGKCDGFQQGPQYGHRGRKGHFEGRGEHRGMRANMHQGNKANAKGILEFTEEQKEQMKQLRLEHMKNVQPFKNELKELRVKQQSLLTAEKPDLNALYSNVEKVGQLQKQLMKEKVNHHLEVQKIMTEEQRVLWNASPHKRGHKGDCHHLRCRRG